MATNYNPRIVTDGLVLCLDGANGKSVPKNNIIGTWTDFNSQQAYYDVTGPYSITLKTGNSNWVGYYPATIPSAGQYVFTFKYYQTGSIGSLTVDNDGANDNAYNATLYPSLGEEKTFTKVVDVSATGLTQFFLRRNSGGDIYIYDISYFKLETTWTDLSGSGNNGSLVNGVGYDGSNGGSLSFDGTDDHILGTIPSSTFTGPHSICCWFYRETVKQWSALFSNNVNTTSCSIFTFIDTTNHLGTNQAGVDAAAIAIDLGADHLNKWIYGVITYAGVSLGSAVNVYAYKDGSLLTASGSLYWNMSSSSSYYIGRHFTPLVHIHDGFIPQVSIYNRALTAGEIAQNFNATRGRYGV